MDQCITTRVNDLVKPLIGLQGFTIGRAAAMLWIGLGVGDSEHMLHIQCAFRIRDKDGILVTNLDMFEPSDSVYEKPGFNFDDFDWDIQGENLFDQWVRSLNPDFISALTVLDARVSICGDLTMLLDQDIVLEVFNNVTARECWRLFRRSSGPHLVMTEAGFDEVL